MKIFNPLSITLIIAILLFSLFFSESYIGYTPFLTIVIIAFALSVLNLFLIHHKEIQIRFSVYSSIILTALQIWVLIHYIPSEGTLPITIVFPIICVILHCIAIIAIRREIAGEKLIAVLKKNKKNGKIA